MGKSVHNDVLDAALTELATGTILTVCTSEPTTRTEAVTTYALADVVIDGSDFTIADGDASGRKTTIAQQTDIPIDASGTALHVAICDASVLLYVTTCTSQALTSGGTVTVPAWDVEILDPS
jgi:hypothetical protein